MLKESLKKKKIVLINEVIEVEFKWLLIIDWYFNDIKKIFFI